MANDDATRQAPYERARRVVLGYLGGAILHETNNVLTVMAGVQQLLRSGATLGERIGGMIDQQLTRMDLLVGTIRRLAAEEGGAGMPARAAGFVLETVDRILQLAGKGRGVRVVATVESDAAAPVDGEAAALALLAWSLPLIPSRGQRGLTVELIAGRQVDAAQFRVVLAPGEPDAAAVHASDWACARSVVEAAGGSAEVEFAAGGWTGTIVLPARQAG